MVWCWYCHILNFNRTKFSIYFFCHKNCINHLSSCFKSDIFRQFLDLLFCAFRHSGNWPIRIRILFASFFKRPVASYSLLFWNYIVLLRDSMSLLRFFENLSVSSESKPVRRALSNLRSNYTLVWLLWLLSPLSLLQWMTGDWSTGFGWSVAYFWWPWSAAISAMFDFISASTMVPAICVRFFFKAAKDGVDGGFWGSSIW